MAPSSLLRLSRKTNDLDDIYFPKVAPDELKRETTTNDELEEAIEDLDDWAFYEFKVVR